MIWAVGGTHTTNAITLSVAVNVSGTPGLTGYKNDRTPVLTNN